VVCEIRKCQRWCLVPGLLLILLLLLLHATPRWEAWQQLIPSLAEFLKLRKTHTESKTHNSRFSRGKKNKNKNPNCFLREQQISHRHEEEEPNKKLAQVFLQQQQQQQQQLVNKGTQQQTNNPKILQHPKVVYKIEKISSPKSFLKKNHFLPRSCEMGLVDVTCEKTSQQQVKMMTIIIIIIIFFFFFFFFLFDRTCTGNNLSPTSSTN